MSQKTHIYTIVKPGLILVFIILSLYSTPYIYASTDEVKTNSSDTDVTPGSRINELLRMQGEKNNDPNQGPSEFLPKIWCADIDDEPTKAICWEAYQASLAYYKTGLQQRSTTYTWQHISTRIIFFVVLSLVTLGIYFAWIQFKHDIVLHENNANKSEAKEHSIELSTSGIKVSSPVLGVIILTLSLAFFYLYLVYVYPVVESF